VAVGQSSGKLGVALFTVTARLVMEPGTGMPGDTIAAQGFGFGAGEQIQVYWYNPRAGLGYATANVHGTFSQDTALTFTIPAGAPPGVNEVYGEGQDTRTTGKGYINVQ
jgi:hypothetical protein